ncbi:MAG: hypothetical protein JO269_13890 [Burkholderiaceae bacterium]|nr:hypothetical protein [Burkholderiaceae bacterium]
MQYQEIEDALPNVLTDIGKSSIEAFCSIPGAKEWNPARLLGLQIDYIFYLGLPLSLIGDLSSTAAHLVKLEEYVKKGTVPPKNLYAEVQAAAILSHLGASVEFISTVKGKRTPDLQATWTVNAVDVEVTAPDQKQLHTAARIGLNTLSGTMRSGDIDGHIHAYFVDASDSTSLEQLLEAAIGLLPGDHRGTDKWFIAASPKESDGMSSDIPAWWDVDAPKFVVQSTTVENGKPLRVSLQSLVPPASYINPIKNKAERVQSALNHPFLIAADVSAFPDAHLLAPVEIHQAFPAWDHVSGVMLFSNLFWSGFERKQWQVTLLVNPHAKHQLPVPLREHSDGKLFNLTFILCHPEQNPHFDNRFGLLG